MQQKLIILLVEDQPHCQKVLTKILLKNPVVEKVLSAANADEAMELLSRQTFDIVILNVKLRNAACDGFDICRRIRQAFKNIYVLIYSADDDEEMMLQAKLCGAHAFISKNIEPETLRSFLHLQLFYNAPNFNRCRIFHPDTMNAEAARKAALKQKALVLKDAERVYPFQLKHIMYIKGSGAQSVIHTRPGGIYKPEIVISKTLKELEPMLPGESFKRVHHSHIVNLKYVCHYNQCKVHTLQMMDDEKLPISRQLYKEMTRILERYHESVG